MSTFGALGALRPRALFATQAPALDTAATEPEAARPRRINVRIPRSWLRSLGVFAIAVLAAVIAFHVLSSYLTDDTWAFLGWGRDLRHGIFPPELEHRTFHPLVILTAAALSMLGTNTAPDATILCALTGFALLAVAVWRLAEQLQLPHPAPAFAALAALTSPMLVGISFAAYINLPFAALVAWGVVWELRDRPRLAWTMLIIAGFVRPEGWAFLLAYGALQWWRSPRRRSPRTVGKLLLLSCAPAVIWLSLEWALFGTPLYSFTNTVAPPEAVAQATSASGLWSTLEFCLAPVVLLSAAVGLLAMPFLSPRRAGLTVLGATVIAALTVVAIAGAHFNLPSRQLSAFITFGCVSAAAGISVPAKLLLRRWPGERWSAAGLVLLVGAAVTMSSYAFTYQKLDFDFKVFTVQRLALIDLRAVLARAKPQIDTRGARLNSIASVGAVEGPEITWYLGVPFGSADDRTSQSTQLMVQPGLSDFKRLKHRGLSDRDLVAVPGGWSSVASGSWDIWTPQVNRPVRLDLHGN